MTNLSRDEFFTVQRNSTGLIYSEAPRVNKIFGPNPYFIQLKENTKTSGNNIGQVVSQNGKASEGMLSN